MLVRPVAALVVCALVCASAAPPASADPATEAVAADAATPVDDGRVDSSPPATTNAPDGWTQTVSAKDETQRVIAPLTTAVSSREYQVGGIYSGSLSGPEEADPPEGTLEVGYQIGCGIDMSTSNGVTLTGSAGVTPSLGLGGVDVASLLPEGLVPVVLTPVTGGLAIALKPGIVNVVPVTKKQFRGFDPWILIDGFRIKIDGCVGESFIRSYSFLTRSTDVSDVVTAWYGVTKKV
ncbi:MspA family porin [Mycobacterium sp. NPDC048908]|uniref:MspA family porin n=1 Tax=Mycobacterium sp. NPDC048908 TaxID=3364292 RepID=UPI003712DEBA